MTAAVNHASWRARVWLALGVFSFLVLLIVSPDSWLHCTWDHHDSAWFFTCGKAWMSGMVPYDDFADSKGPLLWLIYGIGYLISPHDFHGVFWLSCIFYTATFYLCYKIALLFLDDGPRSLLASMGMAVFFFFPGIHYEVRAEDFALLFSAAALYHALRLSCRHDMDNHAFACASWWIGVCLASTALIKYNITAMLLAPAVVVVLQCIRCGQRWWQPLWRIVAGAAVVIVPFVAYMLAVGCFDDFVREYFINTLATLGNNKYRMLDAVGMIATHHGMATYLVLVLASVVTAFFTLRRGRLLPLLMFAWYLLIIVRNAKWTYYYASLSLFAIFGVIALVSVISSKRTAVVATAFAAVAIPAALGGIMYLDPSVAWYNSHSEQQADFNCCIEAMKQVNRPRVLYYNMNGSYDVPVDGLPACRYWASQNGSTAEMDSIQVSAIANGDADFVFMLPSSPMNERIDTTRYERMDSHCPEIMTMYKKK